MRKTILLLATGALLSFNSFGEEEHVTIKDLKKNIESHKKYSTKLVESVSKFDKNLSNILFSTISDYTTADKNLIDLQKSAINLDSVLKQEKKMSNEMKMAFLLAKPKMSTELAEKAKNLKDIVIKNKNEITEKLNIVLNIKGKDGKTIDYSTLTEEEITAKKDIILQALFGDKAKSLAEGFSKQIKLGVLNLGNDELISFLTEKSKKVYDGIQTGGDGVGESEKSELVEKSNLNPFNWLADDEFTTSTLKDAEDIRISKLLKMILNGEKFNARKVSQDYLEENKTDEIKLIYSYLLLMSEETSKLEKGYTYLNDIYEAGNKTEGITKAIISYGSKLKKLPDAKIIIDYASYQDNQDVIAKLYDRVFLVLLTKGYKHFEVNYKKFQKTKPLIMNKVSVDFEFIYNLYNAEFAKLNDKKYLNVKKNFKQFYNAPQIQALQLEIQELKKTLNTR